MLFPKHKLLVKSQFHAQVCKIQRNNHKTKNEQQKIPATKKIKYRSLNETFTPNKRAWKEPKSEIFQTSQQLQVKTRRDLRNQRPWVLF